MSEALVRSDQVTIVLGEDEDWDEETEDEVKVRRAGVWRVICLSKAARGRLEVYSSSPFIAHCPRTPHYTA